ncbi:MAG: hypothetical protein ACRC4G_01785 [Alphaproteobacteria bacterium]
MKQKIKSAAFMLSLVAFTQGNALPGTFCPDENDLRRVVSQNLIELTSLQPLTLRIQSQDGNTRTWEVHNAQLYLGNSMTNRLPLQGNHPLLQRVRDIVNQDRVVMDYDMAGFTADQHQRLRMPPQNQTWCLIQFPLEGRGINTFVFRLSLPEPSPNEDAG